MKWNIFLVLFFLSLSLLAQNNQPWNNPLIIAKSSDGKNFTSAAIFQDSSGVPSAIRWKGDTLVCVFQWFRQPIGSLTWDRVAVKYSYDKGVTWTQPKPIVINGLPLNYQRPFDPTITVTPDKRIRIFYSSSEGMPLGGLSEIINTYSSISNDGLNYTFEPNPRFDHPTNRVIDPAIIFFNGVWHYSCPIGAPQNGAYHCTSSDGLIFSEQNNYSSDNTHNWTGNFVEESSAELRFYGSGAQLWYNTSADGFIWKGYINTNLQGGDPSVIKLSNTSYIIVYVGQQYLTGISTNQNDKLLANFVLYQNYPNPFNPSTTIKFALDKASNIGLKVFNILGQEISTLYEGLLSAGNHGYTWSPEGAASGIYYYTLKSGDKFDSRKMLYLR